MGFYKKLDLGIRPTLLSVVAFLVILSVTVTLGLQFYFSKNLATKATIETVKHIKDKTLRHLAQLDKSNFDLISQLELSKKIESMDNLNSPKEILNKRFTTAMLNNNYIYAIYLGYENGDFYEIINLNIDKRLIKKYNVAKNERWLLVKISNSGKTSIEQRYYLDKDLNIVRVKTNNTNYNPTLRPWYKKASKSKGMIKTEPYMFKNLEGMGVTYAKRGNNSKVTIGVDISLKSLSDFLKNEKVVDGSKIYIFQKDGNIIASNRQNRKALDKMDKKIISYMDGKENIINIHKKDYFISINNLKSKYGVDEYFAILVPKSVVMKPLNDEILFSTFINISIIILVIPFITYLSRVISNPIHDLEKENEKIKQRKFNEVEVIETPISELQDLSYSLVSMSESIQKYEEEQRKLMDSFIELIAHAIDEKSQYTGGHCERVPIISLELAKAASQDDSGIFKDFKISSKDELRELSIAAWLHDCGKVTTPEYVVDKATKLETIYNRIHEIRTRFEVVYRDLKIEYYERLLQNEDKQDLDKWLEDSHKTLKDDFEFIANTNVGGEFMKDEDIQRIKQISTRTWQREFDNTIGLSYEEAQRLDKVNNDKKEYLLADKQNHIIHRTSDPSRDNEKYGFKTKVPKYQYNLGEIYNLSVKKGTLTEEERYKINEHINMTIKMLQKLPFPENLKRVPEYAGSHHETLIGTGYPRKLTKEDMSIPARILALADVFEALTATDRPYKEGKKLSQSIKILSFMVKDQHIDKDIFELFLKSGIYLKYGKKYLRAEQIDDVDINEYL